MPEKPEDRLIDRKYVAFDTLSRIASLEMRAKHVVEGMMAGLQRSPYLGVSSEFAQHRQYVPGDDVRHVDWRVYARTERYYVRQFQEETNFVVTFLLDCSESMRYGSASTTKLDHACLLVASLSYLILRQSDAVALATFDEELVNFLPPRMGLGTLAQVASQLETVRNERGTSLTIAVPLIAEMIQRRGIVIVVSDLLDTVEPDTDVRQSALVRSVQRLRHDRHEVIMLHVLDPQELMFDFARRSRFEGLESLPTAVADPKRLRADYLDIMHSFIAQTKAACAQCGADYALANTAEAVDRLLIRYLTSRAKLGGPRR